MTNPYRHVCAMVCFYCESKIVRCFATRGNIKLTTSTPIIVCTLSPDYVLFGIKTKIKRNLSWCCRYRLGERHHRVPPQLRVQHHPHVGLSLPLLFLHLHASLVKLRQRVEHWILSRRPQTDRQDFWERNDALWRHQWNWAGEYDCWRVQDGRQRVDAYHRSCHRILGVSCRLPFLLFLVMYMYYMSKSDYCI